MRNVALTKKLVAIIAIGILAAGCASSNPLSISSPVLSHDGGEIIFSYRYATKYPRLGIYDVETETLAPLNLPFDLMWGSPTISPDGRYIVAKTDCSQGCPEGGTGPQIALMDISKPDVNYRFLTKGEKFRSDPMFTPDGKHVVFVTGRTFVSSQTGQQLVADYGFSMVPNSGGDEVELAPSEKGKNRFSAIGKPYLIEKGRLIFSAILYSGGYLNSELKALGRGKYENVGVVLGFEGEDQRYALMPANKKASISHLTASSAGDIVFVDLNEDEPVSGSTGNFQYELFVLRNGASAQITNIKSFVKAPFISGDGSRVVFLEDKNKAAGWEVKLLDVESGKVTNTYIREKILKQIKNEETK